VKSNRLGLMGLHLMIKLPRLPLGWKDQPQLFERYWDQAMSQIEININEILALPEIQAALVTINAAAADASAAAAVAADAAAVANTAAAEAAALASLTNSGVTGISIVASDAGASASISISAHTRLYGDGVSVSVAGGSVAGLAYSTTYYIYYDQPSRAGGAVTYVVTTNQLTAAQNGDRHLVGSATTPIALGLALDGYYVGVSGIGSIQY